MKLIVPPKITAQLCEAAGLGHPKTAYGMAIPGQLCKAIIAYVQANAEEVAAQVGVDQLPPRIGVMSGVLQPDGSMDVVLGDLAMAHAPPPQRADQPTPGGLSTVVRPGDMNALVRSFPCLRCKAAAGWCGFEAWARFTTSGLSGGERDAACFVLFVWNCTENQAGKHRIGKTSLKFNLAHAMNCWDEGNLAAFTAWAARPWFA